MRGLSRVLAVAAALAVLLTACHTSQKPGPGVTPPASAAPTATATASGLPGTPPITATAMPTATLTPTPASPPASTAPHTSSSPPETPGKTLQSAEAYVQANNTIGGTLGFVDPGSTWVDANTLHVLHATPQGAAGAGGDTFYFFVNGALVGQYMFTQSEQAAPVNSTEFSVTYAAYKPGDAVCCPSGGVSTARFQWNGSKLVSLDPMTGATLS
ncbi:MAG TPA: LppP/LprE family lipoprotein [Actinomycetota bacterium]|nr:LppP/LprE family lipoprotein [Actinomycetota bacterium]